MTERIEETISGYTAAMVINVHGHDLDTLDHDAKKIAGVLSGIKGASEIQIQSPPGTPELAIRLGPERLAAFGLQSLDVLENIQAAYEGVQATQIYQNNQIILILDDVDIHILPEYLQYFQTFSVINSGGFLEEDEEEMTEITKSKSSKIMQFSKASTASSNRLNFKLISANFLQYCGF